MIPLIIGSAVVISGLIGYSLWKNKKDIKKDKKLITHYVMKPMSLNDKLICELKDKIRNMKADNVVINEDQYHC